MYKFQLGLHKIESFSRSAVVGSECKIKAKAGLARFKACQLIVKAIADCSGLAAGDWGKP